MGNKMRDTIDIAIHGRLELRAVTPAVNPAALAASSKWQSGSSVNTKPTKHMLPKHAP